MSIDTNLQHQESFEIFKSKFDLLLDSADEIKAILLSGNQSDEFRQVPISSLFQIFRDSLQETVENSLSYMRNRESVIEIMQDSASSS